MIIYRPTIFFHVKFRNVNLGGLRGDWKGVKVMSKEGRMVPSLEKAQIMSYFVCPWYNFK
jgi:hypothetical protein